MEIYFATLLLANAGKYYHNESRFKKFKSTLLMTYVRICFGLLIHRRTETFGAGVCDNLRPLRRAMEFWKYFAAPLQSLSLQTGPLQFITIAIPTA